MHREWRGKSRHTRLQWGRTPQNTRGFFFHFNFLYFLFVHSPSDDDTQGAFAWPRRFGICTTDYKRRYPHWLEVKAYCGKLLEGTSVGGACTPVKTMTLSVHLAPRALGIRYAHGVVRGHKMEVSARASAPS